MPDTKRRYHWPRSPFASEASDSASNSLFLEILDWMLAPLLVLWPISIAFTNHYAHLIADEPYDGALIESVQVVSDYLEGLGRRHPTILPRAVQMVVTGDGLDSRFYRISIALPPAAEPLPVPSSEFSLEQPGEWKAERQRRPVEVAPTPYDMDTAEIPLVPVPPGDAATAIHLRDDLVRGESVRIAYRTVHVASGETLLVQVAETRNKRESLVSRIIRGVLLPQFAMIPVAVLLSYFGLSRGLAPLRRLRGRILGRRPGDLSPLRTEGVPEEVRPLLLALNDMMRRLEGNLQAQQRFVADAAHQLRTPLTGLKTQADLAVDETDPERLRRSVRLIAESADRAAHLTNQLLTLARTEASNDRLFRFEPVDMRALARAVTIEWAERALVKNIDLAFECPPWPHMSEGVALLLREMVSNLLDNAIKYTPDHGRVTVRVRQTEFVVMEVEDSGPGIAPTERGKVFERFYRVAGSDETGSGLGLPIVLEIADLHRARIELLEAQAGGCLFRVSLVRRGGVANPLELRPD